MIVLRRVFVILFAFLAACLMDGLVLAIGLLGQGWGAQGDPAVRAGFVVLVMFGSSFTGAIGTLPWFLVILLSESFSLRSVLVYALAGVAFMLFAYYGVGLGAEESIDQAGPISQGVELAIATGAVFGFVYWAIAGRNAGKWTPSQQQSRQPSRQA